MADEQVITAPVETVAPVETAAPAPVVETAAPTPGKPLERHEVIRQALETKRGQHAANQPRAQTGQWTDGTPQFPRPQLPAAQIQRPAMPKSLKRELQMHWDAVPAELAAAVAQREADFERGITQYKTQATEYKTQAEQAAAILDQFKPYEWILKNENATPQTAIGPLLQTAAILRTGTPAQKAHAVVQTMRQFQIPVEHIQQMLQAGGNAPAPAPDLRYGQLEQTVNQLKETLTQREQREAQQQESRTLSVIQQFAADPKNMHFEAVQDRMAVLLQAPAILGDISAMSEREKLQAAYDTAVRMDPALSAQVAAHQQARQQAVNTSRAAAVQVSGAPGSSIRTAARPDPKDRRAVIANAFAALRA